MKNGRGGLKMGVGEVFVVSVGFFTVSDEAGQCSRRRRCYILL